MPEVFISYSRKDKDFVANLNQALAEQQRDTWLDTKDIPPTAEWLKEIFSAIEAADTFVFVMSPDGILSPICQQELMHALEHHKKIIPLVRREVDTKTVPESLAKLNWLFFREHDNFDASFQTLVKAINTDLDHVRAHTRFLLKAIDWETKGHDQGLLLRGLDLKEGEVWLAQNSEKEPKSTPLQVTYILASRQAAVKRQRILLGAVTFALIVAVGLAVLAFYQSQLAQRRGLIALSRQLAAQSRSLLESEFDLALLLSVEAIRVSKEIVAAGSSWAGWLQKSVFLWDRESAEAMEPRSSLLEALNYKPTRLAYLRTPGSGESLRFSPDGRTLATLSRKDVYDNKVYVGPQYYLTFWDAGTGQMLGPPLHSPNSNTILGFSRDMKTLVTAALIDVYSKQPAVVTCWDIANGRQTVQKTYPGGVALAFSTQRDLLAVAEKNRVHLFIIGQPQPLVSLECPAPISDKAGMKFSRDGKTLAVSLQNRTLMVWEVMSLRNPRLVCQEILEMDCWALSPDGKTLALVRDDEKHSLSGGIVRLWSVDQKRQVGEIPFTGTGYFLKHYRLELAFSPDGRTLALGDMFRNSVLLWDWTTPQPREVKLPGHVGGVRTLGFSPNGQVLAAASWDGPNILWGISGQQRLGQSLETPNVTCAVFNLQGDTLALGGEDTVKVFATDALFTPGAHPKILPGKAQQVVFSPDGKLLAAVDDARAVTLWDLDRGKPVTEPLQLTDASGSWRGKRVALTWEGADRVLAAKSWELGDTSGYAISLWDVRQRQLLGEPLRGHKEQVLCMAFSPDARTLASGDAEGNIRLWDVATGKQRVILSTGQTKSVDALAFQRDGSLLVSGHSDGRVIFWDLVHDQQLGPNLKFHRDTVSSIAFNPTGLTVASTSGDETFLWDVASRRPLGRLPHGLHFGTLAFSPNGKQLLLVGSEAQRQMLWDVDQDSWQAQACRIANRNLTHDEWLYYLGNEPYRPTCPSLAALNTPETPVIADKAAIPAPTPALTPAPTPVKPEEKAEVAVEPPPEEGKKPVMPPPPPQQEETKAPEQEAPIAPEPKAIPTVNWSVRAEAFKKAQDWQGLQAHCRRWTQAEPDNYLAWAELGITYEKRLNRYGDAVEAYRKALRLKPDEARVWYNQGVAYQLWGRHREAIAPYQEATRLKPDYVSAWNNLGVAYNKMGRLREAIAAYREALRLKPDHTDAWSNLANVYALSGNRSAALEAVKELRRYDPQKAEKLFNSIMKQ
jgi:WD40 repeat protein/predicted TPR repeat methyltransferase